MYSQRVISFSFIVTFTLFTQIILLGPFLNTFNCSKSEIFKLDEASIIKYQFSGLLSLIVTPVNSGS
ncbi:MAG: hypothetical protein LBQ24_03330 [Candidatus Peribacteria bacterium]|nr:hypothetical protein [Candidatus Peribacteria bacterium]